VTTAAAVGEQLGSGAKLLDIQWEGFARTASDELYHAVWRNVTGTRSVEMPFAARVLRYNHQVLADPGQLLAADEERENWLVQLEVPAETLQLLRSQLLSRNDFLAFLEEQERF